MQFNVNDYASMTGKNRLPCIQTMRYCSVEMEKRGNITKTSLFSLPVEMGRTATDFGGHLIANSKVPVFPWVTDIPGYRF